MAGRRKKPKRNISPEERDRRSKWAKEAHLQVVKDPDTGEERPKFGGNQHKKRVATSITELADELRHDVQEAFRRGLNSASEGERRRWVELLLRTEDKEKHLEIAERREMDEAQRTAILARVLRRIEQGPGGGARVLEGGLPDLQLGGAGHDPDGVLELGEGDWTED